MVGKKIKAKKNKVVLRKIEPVVDAIVETPLVERKKFNIWEFLGIKKSE